MASDRRAQLERRRRRVLREDLASETPSPDNGAPREAGSSHAGPSYARAARAERQPRVTDFVAQQPATLWIIFLCGLTVIAGIQALYVHGSSWARWLDPSDLASLDLSPAGSLASWFSSLVLSCAAAYAMLVFSIRRHKLDDYRGRYTLWLWASAGCLIASIDTTARLHQTIRGALVALTGTTLVGDGSVWWIGCGGSLLGVIAARVFLDMRASRGACALFALGASCYLLATAAHLGWVHWIDKVVTVMLQHAALLVGHWLLLMSFLVYSRYVFLDAQGEIASTADAVQPAGRQRLRLFTFAEREAGASRSENRDPPAAGKQTPRRPSPPARKPPRETEGPPSGEPAAKSQAQPASNQQSKQQTPMRVHTADDDQRQDSQEESEASQHSKAERRRLRKLQRRQNRAA